MSFKPPLSVARAALKGLELHDKYGRGGTRVGLIRANQLAGRKPLTLSTIMRMWLFFARHEKNKSTPPEKGNGKIAWLLWGGDPGQRWAEKVLETRGFRVRK